MDNMNASSRRTGSCSGKGEPRNGQDGPMMCETPTLMVRIKLLHKPAQNCSRGFVSYLKVISQSTQ
jgi:hypothetical protein